eukprot:scaffold60711_cov65-Attheya_sp.AAC.3
MIVAKADTNIGAISMDNGHTVKSVDAELNMSQWKNFMHYYRNAMEKIRQKTDFTDADIHQYQEQFDLFFQEWMRMYGLKGVTNYIHHLLSSGHMSNYLYTKGEIYTYTPSKAGSESLNNLMKILFF